MLSGVLDDTFGLSYFKVSVLGGLSVREEPKLTSALTGKTISYDSTVTTSKNIWRDESQNFFINITEGGWILIKQGNLNLCDRVKGPLIVTGDWRYEVVNPFGSRFAKSFNISEAKERHNTLHKSGSIIKAVRKRTDVGSAIVMVQLDLNFGWIFEHSVTGQVLDRQGDEMVVLPLDDNREFRDFSAKVINPNGVQILGTPIGSSVSKGRLEAEKIFQCWETLTIPIYPDSIDDGNDPKHATPVGVMQYFRLKDNKGWVLSTMRRNNDQNGENPGEISSQYTVEVVEVPNPKAVTSSSAIDGRHIMPAPRAKVFSPPLKSLGSRDAEGNEISLLPEGSSDAIGEPIDAPELDTYDIEDDCFEDKIIEDCAIEAWYRIVFSKGLRLRSSASMHDVKDAALPFGCFVKASQRTVKISRTKPSEGAGGAVISSLFDQKGARARATSRVGGSKSVYLKLSECIGADVAEDSWIFESVTDLDTIGGPDVGVITAAARTAEPVVEIESSLMMALHPTGMALRLTPHIDSFSLGRVVKMYECIEASAMVSLPDNSEKFARVDGDFWLPCMDGGREVVVEVPRQPFFRHGLFEITMKSDCSTLVGPYPDSPLLFDVLLSGSTLKFDVVTWYPTADGVIIGTEVFYRLQQFSSGGHVPDIWVRRDDTILNIIERSLMA